MRETNEKMMHAQQRFSQLFFLKDKIKIVVLLCLFACIGLSCEKELETIKVEGFVRDEISAEPIGGMHISVDAIKTSGGILGGRREQVGQGYTNASGYFKIKLKVFKHADRLDFDINGGHVKEGYTYSQEAVNIAALNSQVDKTLNFKLSATALLKIKFKNATPVSDSDLFSFSYTANGVGWCKGILKKEICGTVTVNEAAQFIGKDVCGEYTVETIADRNTGIFWNVKKNGVNRLYIDSVFAKRGSINEFSINY